MIINDILLYLNNHSKIVNIGNNHKNMIEIAERHRRPTVMV